MSYVYDFSYWHYHMSVIKIGHQQHDAVDAQTNRGKTVPTQKRE